MIIRHYSPCGVMVSAPVWGHGFKFQFGQIFYSCIFITDCFLIPLQHMQLVFK